MRRKRHNPIPRAARGFTLPEVLAALVLIGIVLPPVMRAMSLSMQAATHARCLAEATSLGEAKLNELIALGEYGLTTGLSGDFGADWPDYRWVCESYERESGLHEIVLQVVWMERGAERTLNFATLVRDSAAETTTTLGGIQ